MAKTLDSATKWKEIRNEEINDYEEQEDDQGEFGAILIIPEGTDRENPEFKEFEKDVEAMVKSMNKFLEKKDDNTK